MKGISQQKAKENSIRYRAMYSQWSDSGTTPEQLGKEYDVTNKWSEFKELYSDVDQTQRAFNEWLSENRIKLISNNQKTAPHTGWDW